MSLKPYFRVELDPHPIVEDGTGYICQRLTIETTRGTKEVLIPEAMDLGFVCFIIQGKLQEMLVKKNGKVR